MNGKGHRTMLGLGRRLLRWILGLVSVAAMVLLVGYFDRQGRGSGSVATELPAAGEAVGQTGTETRLSRESWPAGSSQSAGSSVRARAPWEREHDDYDDDDDGWEREDGEDGEHAARAYVRSAGGWYDDDEGWESLLSRLTNASPSGDARPLRSRAS